MSRGGETLSLWERVGAEGAGVRGYDLTRKGANPSSGRCAATFSQWEKGSRPNIDAKSGPHTP